MSTSATFKIQTFSLISGSFFVFRFEVLLTKVVCHCFSLLINHNSKNIVSSILEISAISKLTD